MGWSAENLAAFEASVAASAKPHRGWSAERDAILTEGRVARRGFADIASELGVSEEVCVARASVLRKRGLWPENAAVGRTDLWSEAQIADAIRRMEAGATREEAAQALGRSRASIQGLLRRLGREELGHAPGPARPSTDWSAQEIATLRRIVAGGQSFSDAANALGRTRPAVRGMAKRIGLKSLYRPKDSPRKARQTAPMRALAFAPRKPIGRMASPPAKTVARKSRGWLTASSAEPRRVEIFELRDADCSFPFGDPGDEDFRYCGAPVFGRTPFCAAHCRLAYRID